MGTRPRGSGVGRVSRFAANAGCQARGTIGQKSLRSRVSGVGSSGEGDRARWKVRSYRILAPPAGPCLSHITLPSPAVSCAQAFHVPTSVPGADSGPLLGPYWRLPRRWEESGNHGPRPPCSLHRVKIQDVLFFALCKDLLQQRDPARGTSSAQGEGPRRKPGVHLVDFKGEGWCLRPGLTTWPLFQISALLGSLQNSQPGSLHGGTRGDQGPSPAEGRAGVRQARSALASVRGSSDFSPVRC